MRAELGPPGRPLKSYFQRPAPPSLLSPPEGEKIKEGCQFLRRVLGFVKSALSAEALSQHPARGL